MYFLCIFNVFRPRIQGQNPCEMEGFCDPRSHVRKTVPSSFKQYANFTNESNQIHLRPWAYTHSGIASIQNDAIQERNSLGQPLLQAEALLGRFSSWIAYFSRPAMRGVQSSWASLSSNWNLCWRFPLVSKFRCLFQKCSLTSFVIASIPAFSVSRNCKVWFRTCWRLLSRLSSM